VPCSRRSSRISSFFVSPSGRDIIDCLPIFSNCLQEAGIFSGRILAGFLAVLLMMVAGAAQPTRVVQAEEILKKIELGLPVEYDNVIVEGDLDLSELNLTRVPVERTEDEKYEGLADYEVVVTSPIAIRKSLIKGSLNSDGANFKSKTDFYGTTFERPAFLMDSRFSQRANFDSAQFNQDADFRYAQFNETAEFVSVQFNQIADYYNSQFNRTANFWSAQFNQDADFRYAQFNNDVYFACTQFNDTTDFGRVRFNQLANFRSAQFNRSASFKSAQFNQTADFERVKFNHIVGFRSVLFNQIANFRSAQFNQSAYFGIARFNKNADFYSAQFKQDAGFGNAQFKQDAYFTSAQFNQEVHFEDTKFQYIFFNSSQLSKEAFFQGAQINGTLSLYRTKYDSLNIRWSSIHDLAYDDTAYHLLIQNFNRLGFTDDASECQYSYRCKHREEIFRQHKFDLWLFDLMAWATYGYGLRPVRPLGWAALFILVGGLFFFLTRSVTRSKAGQSEKRRPALRRSVEKPDGEVSIWEALLLAATYFTSGASSIISATPAEFVPVGRGRYVVVLLRLLGWIFFVIFLSSLTRTV
jgi:hypothetical protein